MSKYPLNSLREIRSDLSAITDKLGYLLSDMECKSRSMAQSTDRFQVLPAIRRIEEFVKGLDDCINGKENAAMKAPLEAHLEVHMAASRAIPR